MKKLMKRFKKPLLITGALITAYLIYCVVYIANEKPAATSAPVREEITSAAIYNLVNDERQKAGVARLSQNPALNDSAKKKCDDMVAGNYYEHMNPTTGRSGYEYINEAVENERSASENLNQGIFTANKFVIDGWLNSASHKAAMLDPKYTDTGVAVCHIPSEPANSVTVVQHFLKYWTAEELNALRAQQTPQAQQSRSQSCITTYTKAYPGMPAQAITSCH